jgi:gliding motility-associated-like protein
MLGYSLFTINVMEMKRIVLLKILLLIASLGYAQVPVIANISATNLYPLGRVVITGSGFSATSSNLQVWFGQTQGTIISSTEFSITVDVPAAASFSNVEVINKSSRRSATSTFKFLPSFYGEPFEATRFVEAGSYTAINEMRDLCGCDLNNDGKPDMVATKFSAATDMLILQNTSTGPGNISFSKISYALNFASDHVICGDVDDDGFQDLVVTKGGASNRNTVFVIRNNSVAGGTISLSSTPWSLFMDVGHVAIRTSLRDLTGDGRPEIVATNAGNNILYIFQNDPTKPAGSNPFITTGIKIPIGDLTNTYGVEVQDFDGDGKAEILLNAVASPNHYILKNRSATAIDFDSPQRINLAGQLRNLYSADLNKDGKLDLITSSTGTNKVLVLLNQSSPGAFLFSSTPIELPCDEAPWGVSISDIDGDLDPDIVVANQTVKSVNVFTHNGDWSSPTFSKNTIVTQRPARNVVAADMDRDGRPEISIASYVIGSYSVDVYRNTICHKPAILTEAPAYLCNNPVELTAVPAINVTFEWKRGTTSIKNSTDPFAPATVGGTYTVYTSSINPAGECTNVASEPFDVIGSAGSVPEDPVINLTSPICSGSTLSMSTPDVTAGATYKWVGPNWTTTTSTASASIPNITAANAGAYTVQIIVGNCKSNISAPKQADVVSVDNFVLSSNSSTNSACKLGTVKLSVNSVSGFAYEWKRDGVSLGAPSATTTYDATIEGQYTVRVTNAGLGCPAQDVGPLKVTILEPPVADFSIGDPKCANVPIQFTNLSVVDPDSEGTNPPAPVQWSWNFGNATSSTEKNPVNTYTGSGNTYNVSLTVNYRGVTGCTHTKGPVSLTVTSSTVPVITPSSSAICPGETATLTVAGDFQSLSWEHGATGTPISITAPGTYTVNATDLSGCIVPKSIEIGSKEVPVIVITPENPAIPSGQSVQLFATGAHTFEWSPTESLNDYRTPDPVASPISTTVYTVIGTFTGGCSAQATVTVLVDVTQIDIQIPLAFSPNGDEANQKWEITGIEKYPDCTMNIFDSRGKRVYQKKAYDNQWDGTFEGKPVPNGTYYYVFSCPNLKPLTGSVLIFR